MPVFIRLRLAAIRLARALRNSIRTETEHWEIGTDDEQRPIVAAGPFRLVVTPRAVRLFDTLHLYCDGVEVWLPLWWRLRIRNAVRLAIAEHALEMFDHADLAVSTTKARTTRRRERQTA